MVQPVNEELWWLAGLTVSVDLLILLCVQKAGLMVEQCYDCSQNAEQRMD